MVAKGPILEFRGEHRRASSFYDGEDAGFQLTPPQLYGSPLGAWLRGEVITRRWCRSREYGFQALKCVRREDAEWILESKDSVQAKRRGSAKGEDGRRVELISGWDARDGRGGLAQAAMLHCARLQFMPEGGMRDYLRSTGYRPMVEETTRWHDVLWGAVWALPGAEDGLRVWAREHEVPANGTPRELRGHNWLGRVLMRVRAEIDCEVRL
jgi:predicted NAD-dependent protein-ADP-ribosyltransferase YbiA (DUF1768 family)